MSKNTCPVCGEKNPPEAVMCWACYTDLMPCSRVWKAVARLGIGPYARAYREIDSEGQRDPIERILDTILQYAMRDEASDIYIEPEAKGVKILYRIDGEVREQMKVPMYVLRPLASHIKERGHRQDQSTAGRIDFVWDGRSKIWNVNTEATEFGEKVVLSTPVPA